jgi:hypothetical protein
MYGIVYLYMMNNKKWLNNNFFIKLLKLEHKEKYQAIYIKSIYQIY